MTKKLNKKKTEKKDDDLIEIPYTPKIAKIGYKPVLHHCFTCPCCVAWKDEHRLASQAAAD